MIVGTDIGNTYKGQMGTGFAVVNPYDYKYDLALKQERDTLAAKEKAAKEARINNAYEQMNKVVPDNWYVHDKQMSSLMEGWRDLGGRVIQQGEDPFTGTSQDAENFRRLQAKIAQYGEYSKQKKAEFADIQKAYKNGEEIENWDDILLQATDEDLIGSVEKNAKPIKPIFKKPEISTFKAMNEYWDKWRLNNKERIPTIDDAKKMAEEITNDPTLSQGFASVGSKFKQRYDTLPEEQKEALSARGGRLNGYQQYVAEQMYALSNPNFNTEESILKLAGDIKTSISDVERGDKTIKSRYSKHSDKDLEGYIDATLQDGAVQREVEAGKYGDPNRGIDFNRKAAIKHYLPTLKKNISTEYSEKYDEGGKDKQAFKVSEKEWLDDFRGVNGKAAQDNARERLRGITLPGGEVTLTFGDEGVGTDEAGNIMTLASEKVLPPDEFGDTQRQVSGTPINVKQATDEQLLRYLYESNKLKGTPYKRATEIGATADDIGTPSKKTTADDL